MDLINQNKEFDKKRYLNHSNIVYISTFFAFFVVIPLFFFAQSPLILGLTFFSMGIAVLVYYLNQRGYYGLASLLFITFMTIQTTAETFVYGLEPGFVYYYFNMSVLIVYTNWKGWMKFVGISVQALLFLLSFLLVRNQTPLVVMPDWLIITFHTINVILNVIAVANSSNFYQTAASIAFKKLSDLATTDYLTNIPNRTAFGNYLVEIGEKHKKHAHATGIMMIDIDHFKDINDTYGHITGDIVLKNIARILKSYKADTDFLGRYGGEEFVFIKHNINEIDFIALAEQVRKDIEEKHFVIDELVLHLTVSVGAYFNAENNHIDCHLAVKKADDLLYQAKRAGRNVVKHQSN